MALLLVLDSKIDFTWNLKWQKNPDVTFFQEGKFMMAQKKWNLQRVVEKKNHSFGRDHQSSSQKRNLFFAHQKKISMFQKNSSRFSCCSLIIHLINGVCLITEPMHNVQFLNITLVQILFKNVINHGIKQYFWFNNFCTFLLIS